MANNFVDPFANENDDEIELDLSNVQNAFWVPAGKYEGYLVGLAFAESKAKNPMYEWTFRLTGKRFEGEAFVDANTPEMVIGGKEFTARTALTPQAMWKVAEVAEALGVGSTGSVSKFKKSEILGTLALLTLEDNEFNGRTNSSLNVVEAHPKTPGKKVQPAGVPD